MISNVERSIAFEKRARRLRLAAEASRELPQFRVILLRKVRDFRILARALRLKAAS